MESRPHITQVNITGVQFVRFEGALSDDEHAAFLEDSAAQIDQAIAERLETRIVMIIDANRASGGSSVQRKRQADWQKKYAGYLEAHVVVGIFVAKSALIRGALRAITWISPFPYPVELTSEIEPALVLACELLRRDRCDVPMPHELEKIRACYPEPARQTG